MRLRLIASLIGICLAVGCSQADSGDQPDGGGSDQTASDPTYQWHTFFGSEYDDWGQSVAVDGSGNLYLSGCSYDSWTGPNGESPLNPHSDDYWSDQNIYVAKLDSSGEYLWHTFYGTSDGYHCGNSVTIDDSGDIYVTGNSKGSWTGPNGETSLNNNSGNVFVLKLDSSGDYRWHGFYGNPTHDKGNSVAVDSGGNVYVTGNAWSTWIGPSPLNEYAGDTSGPIDLFVLKLDSSGAYQWHTFYGATSSELGKSVAVDSGNNVYLTGYSSDPWTGPNGESPLHEHSGNGEIYILKLNSSGTYQWHAFYGSSGGDSGSSVAVDGSGNVYISGDSSDWVGPNGENPLNTHSDGDNTDILVLVMDSDGAYKWHTYFGPSTSNEGTSLALDDSGNIYIAGESWDTWNGPSGESPLHAHSGYNTGPYDLFVLKLDQSGTYQWHTFYGSSAGETVGSLALDDSANIYVTGYSYEWTGPSDTGPLHAHTTPSGSGKTYFDAFVLKLRE